MTDRPKLYPSHRHQWVSTTCGHIHGFGEDCSHPSAALVTCTVCGFQAPRNAAGLDGALHQIADNMQAARELEETARRLEAIINGPDPQPEQETRSDA